MHTAAQQRNALLKRAYDVISNLQVHHACHNDFIMCLSMQQPCIFFEALSERLGEAKPVYTECSWSLENHSHMACTRCPNEASHATCSRMAMQL